MLSGIFISSLFTIKTWKHSLIRMAHQREIVNGDAIEWLSHRSLPAKTGIFTSIPDISELPEIFSSGPQLKLEE